MGDGYGVGAVGAPWALAGVANAWPLEGPERWRCSGHGRKASC